MQSCVARRLEALSTQEASEKDRDTNMATVGCNAEMAAHCRAIFAVGTWMVKVWMSRSSWMRRTATRRSASDKRR